MSVGLFDEFVSCDVIASASPIELNLTPFRQLFSASLLMEMPFWISPSPLNFEGRHRPTKEHVWSTIICYHRATNVALRLRQCYHEIPNKTNHKSAFISKQTWNRVTFCDPVTRKSSDPETQSTR
jgi:hypothetical protein